MTLQRDPDGRRSVHVEVEVPGTPEQVWQAIATGPGISAWFVPTTVDGKEGGEITSDFGVGMVSTAKITAYEPPFRLAVQDPGWGPGMPPVATEWTVEAKAGGTCTVRVVHSLFASSDDWDGQLEGTEHGWPAYFRVLRRYLEQFAGQPSALVMAVAMAAEGLDEAWPKLLAAMQCESPAAGQRLTVAPSAEVALAGRIERVDQVGEGRALQAQLDQPAPGTFVAGAYACGGTMISLSAYLYGSGADAAADTLRPHLQGWVDEHFPAPAERPQG